MNLGRCPTCHAHLDLAALVEDDAAREVMAQLAGFEPALARAVLAYLCLFRPARQDLRWTRTLALLQQLQALEPDRGRLAAALEATTEAIRGKGGALPLRDHAYLKRVLNGLQGAVALPVAQAGPARTAPGSRTVETLTHLERLKRQALDDGDGQPA